MRCVLHEEIVEHARAGNLLDAIFKDYGRRYIPPGDPTIAALAELHNDGEIDLLGIVTTEAIAAFEKPVFFQGQQVYRGLIRHIDASAEKLLTVVQLLIDAAGHDLAAGMPVEEFAAWCERDPKRPGELMALVDAKFPNADRFLTIAIKYGALVDRAAFIDRGYGFLTSESDTEKQNAIYALGQVKLTNAAEWQRWRAAFAAMMADAPSDTTRSVMLSALQRRLIGAPARQQAPLTELGVRLLALGGDALLHEAARIWALDPEDIPQTLINASIEALKEVRAENTATLERIDMALMSAIERGEVSMARDFVATLIRRDDDPVDQQVFDSLWHKLNELAGDTLNDWIVAWLLDDDHRLGRALNDAVLGRTDDRILAIDFARYGLRDVDYPYLARRAIGAFFLKPQVMASISAGLLRVASGQARDAVVDLLVDPILFNYSGIADDYLRQIVDDPADPASTAVATALEKREAYLTGLQAIGPVPELWPSERARSIEGQRHADAMQDAWEQARQKSVFASLISQSVLLYGKRSVSYVKDPGVSRRIETPLGSISHSFEVPRIDIVDPIGLQFTLIACRREKRPA